MNYCSLFSKENWRLFYDDYYFNQFFIEKVDCKMIIPLLEENLLNGDITENQKLYNIIDIKIKEIENIIQTFDIVLVNEIINKKSLSFIQNECKGLTGYLLFEVNIDELTVGEFYKFIKNKFADDKEKIEPLFALKSLNINEQAKIIATITHQESNVKSKIKWNGTPGEFGAIFNKLFDNGFIEVVKDKSNMVRVLSELFEIRNEKSEPVNPKYLYKCFGEKEKEYPNGYLKIPLSDNYNKNK